MRYACSIAARKTVKVTFVEDAGQVKGVWTNVETVHTVYVCDADSDAEAQADAYLFAKHRWSEEDGWGKHSVEAIVVPD